MSEHPHLFSPWIAYDEHSPARAEGFDYYRSCQYLGCEVNQRVASVVPEGKMEEWDEDKTQDLAACIDHSCAYCQDCEAYMNDLAEGREHTCLK